MTNQAMTSPQGGFLQVTFPSQSWEREQLDGHLYLLGYLGAVETETELHVYFPIDRRVEIEQSLTELYRRNRLKPDYSITVCEAQNWTTGWQAYFRPQRVTRHIGIRPPWRNFRKPVTVTIIIQPGMAFGTGTHATTQLALQLLEQYIVPGMRVLDAGCGTGVLTIAALKLGAREVDAWDIDPQIRENFQANMQLNALEQGWQLHIGDIVEYDRWDYDLILSNIERTTNERVLARLGQRGARPWVIFTGLLAEDYADFAALVLNYRREILEKRIKQEWLALVVR